MGVFASDYSLDKRWLGKVCTILTLCATVGLSLNMLVLHALVTRVHSWDLAEDQLRKKISTALTYFKLNEEPEFGALSFSSGDFAQYLNPFFAISLVLSILLLVAVVAGILAGRRRWLWGAAPLAVFLTVFFVIRHNQIGPSLLNRDVSPAWYSLCWLTGWINDKSLWVFLVYGALTAIAAACCILQLWFDRKQKQPARG